MNRRSSRVRLRPVLLAVAFWFTAFATEAAPVAPFDRSEDAPLSAPLPFGLGPGAADAAYCATPNPSFQGYLTQTLIEPGAPSVISRITSGNVYGYISNVVDDWACTLYRRYDGVYWVENSGATQGTFNWGTIINSTSTPCNWAIGGDNYLKANNTTSCPSADDHAVMTISLERNAAGTPMEGIFHPGTTHDTLGDFSFVHSDCDTTPYYGHEVIKYNATLIETNTPNRPGANCDALTYDATNTAQTITYDFTAPSGTISIANGLPYSTTGTQTLNPSATDNVAGVAEMRFSNNGSAWSTWQAYATTRPAWDMTGAAFGGMSGDGAKTVYAQYRDANGNSSGSVSDTITLDTVDPTASVSINEDAAVTGSTSVILALAAMDETSGISLTQASNNNVDFLPVSGASASWTLTVGDGLKTVWFRVRDGSGRITTVSDNIVLSTDSTPPPAPSQPDLAAISDSGVSSTDNITSESRPTFIGTAESGATVVLFAGVTAVGTATAADGNWSITTSALGDGPHVVTAKATDPANNTGPASPSLDITIDTSAPATPSIPDLDPASDTGASNTDNVTSDATPSFTGTAEADATVTLLDSGGSLGSGSATAGSWSITTTVLGGGVHAITAEAADAAGNISPSSASISITVSAGPAAPSIPDLEPGSDSGVSSIDDVTNERTPTFVGTADSGSTVTLYDGATDIGSATAAGGVWSVTVSELADGVHDITATSTDSGGIVGGSSSPVSVTVDATEPAADFTEPDEALTTIEETNSTSVQWIESDAGSGIVARSLQMNGGSVVTPGTCSDVIESPIGAPSPSVSPIFFDFLTSGHCYRWIETLTDTAGNVGTVVSGWMLINSGVRATFSAPLDGPSFPVPLTSFSVEWTEPGSIVSRSLQRQSGDPNGGSCVGITFSDIGSATSQPSPIAETGLVDGDCYRWQQTLDDGVGHVITTTSSAILIDTTRPTVTFTTPTVGIVQPGSQALVSWTETDSGAGIGSRSVQWQNLIVGSDRNCVGSGWFNVGGATATPSPMNLSGLFSGRCHRWVVTLTDRVGNTTWATSPTILVDPSPPTADFSVPNEGTTTVVGSGGAHVVWTEADATSGLVSRTLSRERADVSGATCAASWVADGSATNAAAPALSTGMLPDSCYRWVLTLTDEAGNTASRTSGILRNESTILASPLASASVFEMQSFAVSTSVSSVTQVEFLVDGSVHASDDDAPYIGVVDTANLPDGVHTIQVRVTQAGGATTTTPTSSIEVANGLNTTDRLDSDYNSSALSLDSYVINGVYSLLAPHALPSRYETTSGASASDIGLYLQHWNQLQQSTRDELQEFFDQPHRMDLFQPTSNIGGPEATLDDCGHVHTSPPYHGLGGFTVSECWHVTPHFKVIYVAGDADTAKTVDREDLDGDRVPDRIESYETALEYAYDYYSRSTGAGGLAFDPPITGTDKIQVTMQGGDLADVDGKVTINPSDPERVIEYTAAHEVMHVFQYGYKVNKDLGWFERNFWYEATAQWAAKKVSELRHQVDPSIDGTDWAIGGANYLGTPDLELSTETGDQRRYGVWILANYLDTEFAGSNIIRRTWEFLRAGKTGKESIVAAIDEASGTDLPTFFKTYAQDTADGFMPSIPALTEDLVNFGITHPAPDSRYTGEDSAGPARPARDVVSVLASTPAAGKVDVGELGMKYIDLHPAVVSYPSRLSVLVQVPDDGVSARLVTYRLIDSNDPSAGRIACMSTDFAFEANQGSVESNIDSSCTFATLYLVRWAPPTRLALPPIGSPIHWSASVGSGILFNGTIEIGMNDTGNLIVPGGLPSAGTGETAIGLRLFDLGAGLSYDGLSPGCFCEGWGISDGTTSAYAGISLGGTSNLTVQSYSSDGTSVTSSVEAASIFDVVHKVATVPETPNLFRLTVSVTNATSVSRRLLYRRVMDWDVEPTAFSEYVTIEKFGVAPGSLMFDSNDGFASLDPLSTRTSLGATGFFTDYPGDANVGTDDQGAMFDFDFGVLNPGQTKMFDLYYGAAPSEPAALTALQAVGADVYSLAQPTNPGGPDYGLPVTFMFGFSEGN